ncbi:MAG: RNA polymerase sigma factor SigF [Steroidobacteraceae bacterium]
MSESSEADASAALSEMAALPAGSPRRQELRDRVVESYMPLARQLARRFSGRGEPLEDLTQVASMGLINAVDRFDGERGVEFASYAVPTIVGEIKRHFRDHGWAVRVPRRLKELHGTITAGTSDLSQKLGRAPNATELSAHLGLPREEVLEGMRANNAYRSSSLDSSADEAPAMAKTLGVEDPALAGVEYREALQPLLASLPDRERQVVMLRFFASMTQSQIADKIGVSQMHVSRLLSTTLHKLRGQLKEEPTPSGLTRAHIR